MSRRGSRFLLAFIAAAAIAGASGAQTVPTGFQVDTLVSTGLSAPHGFCFLPDGRPLIFERAGGVKLLVNGTLTTIGTVPNVQTSSEQGLLAMVADPGFATNGYLYAWSSRTVSSNTWLMRFTCTGDLANPASSNLNLNAATFYTVLNTVPDGAFNHNGGSLMFANDGMLLVTFGEDADPCGAQTDTALKGKLLRLNVSGLPAGTGTATIAQLDPGNNPLSGSGTNAALVMAKGLRNPFRATFDKVANRIYIGDVGQNAHEEFDEVTYPPGATIVNYGWPIMEGNSGFSSCTGGPFTGLIAPMVDVPQSQGWFAALGGPRYRNVTGGSNSFGPSYEGDYFYSDYFSGQMRRLRFNGTSWVNPPAVPGQPSSTNWGTGFVAISQMDVGPDGAIYFTQHPSTYATSGGFFKRIRPLGPIDVITVLSGAGQVGVRGKAFKNPIQLHVANSLGQALANTAVNLSGANLSFSTGNTAMTDANGDLSVTVTALSQGSLTMTATTSGSGSAQASVFARGLNVIFVNGSTNDTIICQFANTTAGAVPVPFLLGFASPPITPIPTPYGDLHLDLFTLQNTGIIEDGGGLYGGIATSPGGGFGSPGKTMVYTIPHGAAAGLVIDLQIICYDSTVLTSIAGTVDSNFGITNRATLTP